MRAFLSYCSFQNLCAICLALFFCLAWYGYAYPWCNVIGACNFDPAATSFDDSCLVCLPGQRCDGLTACCFDLDTNGVCDYDDVCTYPPWHGCTDPQACNYDATATIDVGNCITCGAWNTCLGAFSCCEDPDGNGVCGFQANVWSTQASYGCNNKFACNFDPTATIDNGTCRFCDTLQYCDKQVQLCCEDLNQNSICDRDEQQVQDDPFTEPVETVALWCTDAWACNYNPRATQDDWECFFCGESESCVWVTCCDDPDQNGVCGDQSLEPIWLVPWCTVVWACNFDPWANDLDDSCIYPQWCTQWCPGSPGEPVFMDVCGVCDADPSNDDVTCRDCAGIPNGWSLIDACGNCLDPASPLFGQGCVDCAGQRNGTRTIDQCGVCGDPSDASFNACIDCAGIPNGNALIGTSCSDGDPLTQNDVWTELCQCRGEPIQELYETLENSLWLQEEELAEMTFPYSDPRKYVAGALYVDFTDPLTQQEFENILEKYAIEFDQPFTYWDKETFRFNFDPNIPHQELIDFLKKNFGKKFEFAEPVPLFQSKVPQVKEWVELLEEIIPDHLWTIQFDKLMEECPQLFPDKSTGIKVAVVDNGYQEHFDLRNNVVETYDVADKDKDVSIGPNQIDKSCAHGNIDAGLVWSDSLNSQWIISVWWSPELVLVKATWDRDVCTDITAGIEWLSKAAERADIVNVSWWIDFESQVLEDVVQRILKKWVVIVAAAGNFDTNRPFYPAAYDGVIAVASVDENNKKSSFSNYGPWIDISAPGENMLSTALDNTFSEANGTSQAAPLVAWWLAFILANGGDVEDVYTYVDPVSSTDLGEWVLNTMKLCREICTPSYISLDYNLDGRVNNDDVTSFADWMQWPFVEQGCRTSFDPFRCCPEGTTCDINADGTVWIDDLTMMQSYIVNGTLIEVCRDGLDNNCDGIVDCEGDPSYDDAEHFVADTQSGGWWFIASWRWAMLAFLAFAYILWYLTKFGWRSLWMLGGERDEENTEA